jgi:hypothetical protein
MDINKILTKIYYDPEEGLIAPYRLYQKVKKHSITFRQVKDWVKQQEVAQVEKGPKKKEYYKITGPLNSFQADLLFIKRKKYKTPYVILNMVNINNRRGYSVPMKNKQKSSVITAMKSLIEKVKIENLTTDNGSEFISLPFKKLMEDNDIDHYLGQVGDHTVMGKIERYNKTIRDHLEKYTVAFGTDFQSKKEFEEVLKKLVRNYNTTVHSSTNLKPKETTVAQENKIRKKASEHNKKLAQKIDYKVGDKVRYSLTKKLFDKGAVKFSRKVYTISKSYGKSYELKDEEDTPVKRRKQDKKPTRFKHWELQRVSSVSVNPNFKKRRARTTVQPRTITTRTRRRTREWYKKYIGKQVRKKFGTKFYRGVVKKYKAPYLVVQYEDGDQEDQTEGEIKKILI